VNSMTQDLVRAQMSARLGEARQLRRSHLARAHRTTRRAEIAASQARTALARAL
jgi:hypothetical protein